MGQSYDERNAFVAVCGKLVTKHMRYLFLRQKELERSFAVLNTQQWPFLNTSMR